MRERAGLNCARSSTEPRQHSLPFLFDAGRPLGGELLEVFADFARLRPTSLVSLRQPSPLFVRLLETWRGGLAGAGGPQLRPIIKRAATAFVAVPVRCGAAVGRRIAGSIRRLRPTSLISLRQPSPLFVRLWRLGGGDLRERAGLSFARSSTEPRQHSLPFLFDAGRPLGGELLEVFADFARLHWSRCASRRRSLFVFWRLGGGTCGSGRASASPDYQASRDSIRCRSCSMRGGSREANCWKYSPTSPDFIDLVAPAVAALCSSLETWRGGLAGAGGPQLRPIINRAATAFVAVPVRCGAAVGRRIAGSVRRLRPTSLVSLRQPSPLFVRLLETWRGGLAGAGGPQLRPIIKRAATAFVAVPVRCGAAVGRRIAGSVRRLRPTSLVSLRQPSPLFVRLWRLGGGDLRERAGLSFARSSTEPRQHSLPFLFDAGRPLGGELLEVFADFARLHWSRCASRRRSLFVFWRLGGGDLRERAGLSFARLSSEPRQHSLPFLFDAGRQSGGELLEVFADFARLHWSRCASRRRSLFVSGDLEGGTCGSGRASASPDHQPSRDSIRCRSCSMRGGSREANCWKYSPTSLISLRQPSASMAMSSLRS